MTTTWTRKNQTSQSLSFLTGIVTGGAIAAGLVLYFQPRLRAQAAKSLKNLRETAGATAQDVLNDVAEVVDRVAEVAEGVTARADEVRNDVASAVEHGAHALSQGARQVERLAKGSKTLHQRHT